MGVLDKAKKGGEFLDFRIPKIVPDLENCLKQWRKYGGLADSLGV